VLGWWQVWCGRLHLCVVRLMPAVRAEPSGRWWRRRSQRRASADEVDRRAVADLGFLLCEDEDLSKAGPFLSDQSGEFQKAPPANVTVHLCLEFAGLGGIRSCAPMILFRLFGSGGSGAKLCPLLPLDDFWSLVKSEAENIMKVGLED
jgi:hypothetical protein